MKFLNTEDSMNIVEIDDDYSEYIIELKDEMLDLVLPDFIYAISSSVKKYNYCKNYPVLFIVKGDNVSEDDIEYSKNLICEIITESIQKEKVNKDWQPRISLSEKLDMTMKAKTNLLNYNTVPNILNIKFVKNDKVLYNIIKD